MGEACRNGQEDQEYRGQSWGARKGEAERGEEEAKQDASQPKAGVVGLREGKQDTFFIGPEVARLIPERGEAVQERYSRKNYYYNKYRERGGQQDGLFAEMLDRREQGKKNQAGGEERQDGGQAGDGGEQAREGAEDQG